VTVPTPTARDLRRALARHRLVEVPALPGRRNHIRTGVLVPLVFEPSPVAVVTQRSTALAEHAGEICFPGGRPEPGDRDLQHTALREAHEELGITGAEVLGRLSAIPLYTTDYRLVPFVAAIPTQPLVPAAGEVAAVLRLELAEVLSRPAIEGIPYELYGHRGLSPVFEVEGRRMYGATAHSFLELLQVVAPLFGREGPPPLRETGLTWADLGLPA
jgi:8-oxo-dGTP pyrophosphatase MutT (NUDIX family)